MVFEKLHKKIFQEVLYEDRKFCVVQYKDDITVKSTSSASISSEINVDVKFNSSADIDETSIEISNEYDTLSACSFNKNKISVLEVRDNKLKYRFGDPETSSQYFVMNEEQYESSSFYKSKFCGQMPDHVKMDVYRDVVPEAVEDRIEDDIIETDVIVDLYGFSEGEKELFMRISEDQPLVKVNIDNPRDVNLFDLRSKDLTAPNLFVDLPNGFNGDLRISNETVRESYDDDYAIVSPRALYDNSYNTLSINGDSDSFELEVKADMDGFVPVTKVVEVKDAVDKLEVSFTWDMFTELGTIYVCTTDIIPDISARSDTSQYNVTSVENSSQMWTELFENNNFSIDQNSVLYKIEDVVPNEEVRIHYGTSVENFSRVTVSEGETKPVFEEISYRKPIVKFENKCDTTLRIITEQKSKSLAQDESFEIHSDSTDIIDYSVVDVNTDCSSVLYTDTFKPSKNYRTHIALNKSDSNVIRPKKS